MNTPLKPKASILYVDDDPQNLSSFKALFRREYIIFLASSAAEGLDILSREDIQILITDQRMPEMTGSQLLELAAERFPKTQRFLLTAYSDFDPLVEAINKGKVQGYFSKPIDDRFIRRRIEEHLAGYYLEYEKKALLRQIQKKEKFLSIVLENIPDIIIVKDAQTLQIKELNQAAEQLLGIDRKTVIGKEAKAFIPEEAAALCHQTDQEILRNLTPLHLPEERIEFSPQEVRYFDTKKIPILNDAGKPEFILRVSREVTEKIQQDLREKRLQQQLVQSQKMEAIGTLAGGIAHDFNNILGLMMGYAELSLAELQNDQHITENLKEIFKAGVRGRDLVKQILTFSRRSNEEQQPIKAVTVIKEVIKLLQASLPKNIEIISIFESDAVIMGNPSQIHQVFMNLCTNALFAMQAQGGTLRIQIADITIDDSSDLTLQGLAPGDYLHMLVSDSGAGISAEIIDLIFEPYFTTKETGQGTGIGLAIVRGIIAAHGGKISVASEIGRGTQFNIYLPVIRKAVENLVRIDETLPGGNERILFVDDEPGLTRINVLILESLGYHVIGCTRSPEALERFRAQPESFDLVITDMAMPQLSGQGLCEELIRIRPEIPIILCSGNFDKLDEKLSTDVHIKARLHKPIKKRELARAVRKVLDLV